MQDCRLEEGSATEALSRLLAAWLELGDRYRVVVANPSQPDNLEARAREERLGEAMQRLILRGQAEGEFSPRRAGTVGHDRPRVRCSWPRSGESARAGSAREDAHPLLIRSVLGCCSPG